MDDDRDLKNFSRLCRLFPLPGVVLFPHSVLPLHIFEPRYRQMTEDALAGDQLITTVQLLSTPTGWSLGSPPVEAVGCLGRIIQHQRLPDGRFNLLLLGRRRVRLTREVPGPKLYRVAAAELLEDRAADPAAESARAELTRLFVNFHQGQGQGVLDPDLAALLAGPLPLGVLTDVLSQALGLPASFKQTLLNCPEVDTRAERLLTVLRRLAAAEPGSGGTGFPPPFSAN